MRDRCPKSVRPTDAAAAARSCVTNTAAGKYSAELERAVGAVANRFRALWTASPPPNEPPEVVLSRIALEALCVLREEDPEAWAAAVGEQRRR